MASHPRHPERLNVLVFNAAGVLLIVGSWFAASDQVRLSTQLYALNAAAAGLLLMVGASGLYLVSLRRALKERSAQLSASLDGTAP